MMILQDIGLALTEMLRKDISVFCVTSRSCADMLGSLQVLMKTFLARWCLVYCSHFPTLRYRLKNLYCISIKWAVVFEYGN